ncbi:hypothetical protein D3C77_678660 [compost metagenome]
MISHLRYFQAFRAIDVFQKLGSFPDRGLLSILDRLGPLHHFCGLVTDVPFVDLGTGVASAVFRFFYFVRPVARSLGRFGQPLNILPQLIVLG